jgi:hypothetical protein
MATGRAVGVLAIPADSRRHAGRVDVDALDLADEDAGAGDISAGVELGEGVHERYICEMLVIYVSHGSVHSPIPLLTMLFIAVAIVVYWTFTRTSLKVRRALAEEDARIARIRAASRPGRRR